MVEPGRYPGEGAIPALIAQVYDAALGQESWTDLLAGMATLLGSDSAVTLHPTGTPQSRDEAVRLRVDPNYVPLYNAHYHTTWPVLSALPRLQAGAVFVDRMVVSDTSFLRSEFYADYARPQGRHSGIYWIDIDSQGLAAHLSLWRTRRRPDWGDAEIRLLRHLGPHLGRALDIGRRLAAIPIRPPAAPVGIVAPREIDCLAWVARGASSKQIARRLGLSMHTVNDYLASARRKLKASSRSEAVAAALQLGLIES